MAKPLSEEIRSMIVKHKENREKETDIAKWLMINPRSVRRIWKQYKTEKTTKPNRDKTGRKPAFGEEITEKIKAEIKEKPDITLWELVEEFDLKISISALCRKLIKENLTFKKRHYLPKNNSEKMSGNSEKSGKNIYRM
jgi:transposase